MMRSIGAGLTIVTAGNCHPVLRRRQRPTFCGRLRVFPSRWRLIFAGARVDVTDGGHVPRAAAAETSGGGGSTRRRSGPPAPSGDYVENIAWYYEIDGACIGPVSQDALCHLLRTAAIGPTTRVRCDALPHWLLAAQVPGFQAVVSPPPLPVTAQQTPP